jgi:hypothetical protein
MYQLISDYYCGLGSDWWTNFPGGYREYDYDDVTLGMHDPHTMQPDNWYVGYTYVQRCANAPSSLLAYVESEWGRDYGFLPDPDPQDDERLGYFYIPTGYTVW